MYGVVDLKMIDSLNIFEFYPHSARLTTLFKCFYARKIVQILNQYKSRSFDILSHILETINPD